MMNPSSIDDEGRSTCININIKKSVIRSQPSCGSFHPWDILSIEDDDDNFEELLDQQQSTAGFEVLADTNVFNVRHRFHEKDAYTKVSKYDIFDSNQQCLLICNKEYNYKCFRLASTIVSAFTDVYKDPIFMTTSSSDFSRGQFCTKITGINGTTIGLICKCTRSEDYTIENEFEDTTLNLICNNVESSLNETLSFDIWEGTTCVANISRTNQNEIAIFTIGSLTCVNKVLLLGFAFYIDGIYRGDNNYGIYSLIGL